MQRFHESKTLATASIGYTGRSPIESMQNMISSAAGGSYGHVNMMPMGQPMTSPMNPGMNHGMNPAMNPGMNPAMNGRPMSFRAPGVPPSSSMAPGPMGMPPQDTTVLHVPRRRSLRSHVE
ncbi:unnamed protein product [Caenorhabditis auriculariae]|uniref:Uncharacterized protein n=1 Tax=Caenorhabditis auriculariae TaxID=2777116 RepID=A0A8S1HC15_9PELO|nr:unnamed protein product [Caenorhabditis auriculariae]